MDDDDRTGPKQLPQLRLRRYDPPDDAATIPRRPPDFFLRKCARIAAATGETLDQFRFAWSRRRKQPWWRLQYANREEPYFKQVEVDRAYFEALIELDR